jgi:hypothetical protein
LGKEFAFGFAVSLRLVVGFALEVAIVFVLAFEFGIGFGMEKGQALVWGWARPGLLGEGLMGRSSVYQAEAWRQ